MTTPQFPWDGDDTTADAASIWEDLLSEYILKYRPQMKSTRVKADYETLQNQRRKLFLNPKTQHDFLCFVAQALSRNKEKYTTPWSTPERAALAVALRSLKSGEFSGIPEGMSDVSVRVLLGPQPKYNSTVQIPRALTLMALEGIRQAHQRIPEEFIESKFARNRRKVLRDEYEILISSTCRSSSCECNDQDKGMHRTSRPPPRPTFKMIGRDYGDPVNKKWFATHPEAKRSWMTENNFKIRTFTCGSIYTRLTTIGPDTHYILHSIEDAPAYISSSVPHHQFSWTKLTRRKPWRNTEYEEKDSNPLFYAEWARQGLVHRDDGPAMIFPRSKSQRMEYRVWVLNGYLKRKNGGPVVQDLDVDYTGSTYQQSIWALHPSAFPIRAGRLGKCVIDAEIQIGPLHREDGPAIVSVATKSSLRKRPTTRTSGTK